MATGEKQGKRSRGEKDRRKDEMKEGWMAERMDGRKDNLNKGRKEERKNEREKKRKKERKKECLLFYSMKGMGIDGPSVFLYFWLLFVERFSLPLAYSV